MQLAHASQSEEIARAGRENSTLSTYLSLYNYEDYVNDYSAFSTLIISREDLCGVVERRLQIHRAHNGTIVEK